MLFIVCVSVKEKTTTRVRVLLNEMTESGRKKWSEFKVEWQRTFGIYADIPLQNGVLRWRVYNPVRAFTFPPTETFVAIVSVFCAD